MNINSSKSNIMPKFNYRDLIIFLVPVLIFSLYLMVYNPGVLTVASYSQLHQIATGHFTTTSPIFHTLLLMLFIKIFGSPFFLGLFQILIFAVIWTVICKYHRDDSKISSNAFVVQFIITLIISLIPINAVYSITLSSNVLFSYSLMFLAFLIKVMLDRNGQIDKKIIILIALTLAVMSGLNNYGIVIAILTLIVISYYMIKTGNFSENTAILLVGLAILGIFLIGSLNFVYDVQKDKFDIHTNDAFEEDIDIHLAQEQFFSTINAEPSESYENLASANIGKSNYNLIDSFVDFWRGSFILDGLFDNPILYLILSVMLLALIYLRTESNEIFMVYVPIFLNFAISLITGQNNQYSVILAFYLIVIICVSLLFNQNLNMGNMKNMASTIPSRKTETLTSSYGNESSYSEPESEYYADLESEIDELTLDDINEMLGKDTHQEPVPQQKPIIKEKPKPQQKPKEESTPQGDSDDLIDQILKEIELENK